jgi:hypothetical protein
MTSEQFRPVQQGGKPEQAKIPEQAEIAEQAGTAEPAKTTEQDSNAMTQLAVLQELTACLRALDQLGAGVAAAHVDAAIHDLLDKLASLKISSKSE